jgi:hypothetical protein
MDVMFFGGIQWHQVGFCRHVIANTTEGDRVSPDYLLSLNRASEDAGFLNLS